MILLLCAISWSMLLLRFCVGSCGWFHWSSETGSLRSKLWFNNDCCMWSFLENVMESSCTALAEMTAERSWLAASFAWIGLQDLIISPLQQPWPFFHFGPGSRRLQVTASAVGFDKFMSSSCPQNPALPMASVISLGAGKICQVQAGTLICSHEKLILLCLATS